MSREVALGHIVPHSPRSPTRMFLCRAAQHSTARLGSGSAQQCEGARTAATQREEAAYVKKWRLGPEGLVRAGEGRGLRENPEGEGHGRIFVLVERLEQSSGRVRGAYKG